MSTNHLRPERKRHSVPSGNTGGQKRADKRHKRMGEVLSNRSCKSGEEGWKAVWEKVLWGRVSDEKIKKIIVEMGGAFFEKNAAAMEQRLKECALDIHKQIDFYRKDYVEKMKVICPVGILGGIMISIMLI